jgi:hypothetical protein
MTRKDFILISSAIRATNERIKAENSHLTAYEATDQLRGVRRAAAHIADALTKENPTFDAGRFLTDCGYGGTTMNPRDPALDLRPLPEPQGNGRWRVSQEELKKF